jgi:hypothetical protein
MAIWDYATQHERLKLYLICNVPLEDSSPLILVQSARALFKAYGEFVRNTGRNAFIARTDLIK